MIKSIEDDFLIFCLGFRVKEEYNSVYIQRLLEDVGDIVVQILDKHFVADLDHAYLILLQSFEAFKRGLYVAKKPSLDIMLRFLCTKKIDKALKNAFPKDDVKEFLLVGFGSREKVELMMKILEGYGIFDEKLLEFSHEKLDFLIKYHGLSRNEVDNYGVGKILCDKSAAVFSKFYKIKSSASTR
ncbi:MAG: KEOPS complex subunit Cgi121 [Nitrososphaeria archaeon]|nr:KEOPS complex subunit Cgi121 [Nitrososphaeria archaeon]